MATLQDVRAFVRRQDNLTPEELERKVAKEFDLSRDEAAQMMRGLESEDPATGATQPTVLNTAVVAAGLGTTQPGGTQNAAGVGALLVTEAETVRDADRDVNNDAAQMENPRERD
jgi:hypothetical protein